MAAPINQAYFGGCEHNHMHLAADKMYELPSFLNVRDLVSSALERIFKNRKADVDPDLFEITYKTLEESVKLGAGEVKYGQPNYALVEQLKESAAIFSSAKTLQQGKELAALITRPDGKYRSWDEFQTLAKQVDENYNQNWLKVEHNTAIRKANAAVDWQKYVENADLYPNLKYLPSKAATPSEEHKVYWNIIKPITDEFWTKHLPPSRYNCQCGSEQTDDEPTGPISGISEPSPGLDNNPGIDGQLFSDSHPYVANLTKEELKYVTKKAKEYVTRRTKDGSRPG
jgi:hypothetical protein